MGLLCVLLIILIVVISSERIRKALGSFLDKLTFRFIPTLLVWIVGITCAVIIGYLVCWGWNKLHEIYPKMWTLKETLVLIGIFVFFGLIAYCKNKLQELSSKHPKLSKIFKREGIILIGVIILGITISIAHIWNSTDYSLNFKVHMGILLVAYLIYAFIRIVAIKKILDNAKND